MAGHVAVQRLDSGVVLGENRDGEGEPEGASSPIRNLDTLEAGGMDIYAYAPARLHARTVVIDGVWATIGSLTLDHRSFGQHDEVNLVVYSASVAGRLEQAFDDDVRHARRITSDVGRRRAAPPHGAGLAAR